MNSFSNLNRRANEAKSLEDLSAVASEAERKRLTDKERIVLAEVLKMRREYLAKLARIG